MKKKEFKNLDKDYLIGLLVELSKLNKENDSFLKSKLSSDFEDLFNLSCRKVDKAFSCFEFMSLKDARQAINDFKKSNPDNAMVIELCLHYIKRAYELEKTDWRFQENFYSAIEKVYGIIFEIFKNNPELKKKYDAQINSLIKESNSGWGHRDYLEDRYREIK